MKIFPVSGCILSWKPGHDKGAADEARNHSQVSLQPQKLPAFPLFGGGMGSMGTVFPGFPETKEQTGTFLKSGSPRIDIPFLVNLGCNGCIYPGARKSFRGALS